ncbi:hypothetical protein IEQ34_015251 [Dendrobium chrysotoxum]|uniref:Peptidase A1 domain-containing protein n=1 Tax=Dendrobium chrysotoxum TaxID=161865 RepID=A0AAV7G059_DENCH|nr:hypothetical protein IEQ34_015251 [Dendrobium chrysotoxum]
MASIIVDSLPSSASIVVDRHSYSSASIVVDSPFSSAVHRSSQAPGSDTKLMCYTFKFSKVQLRNSIHMATSSSLLSCYTLLNIFFFLLLIEKNSLVSAQGLQGEYHFIDVESLLPSKSCSMPDKGMSPFMRILVDQCGTCSPLVCKDKLSLEDKYHQILKQDQARVDYINRLDATNSACFNPLGGSLFATVPIEEGVIVGSHNFIVTIYLGTPPMPYSVIFDTGSDLTWIQCIPYDKCYPQKHPIYNPFESSTYASISCSSNYCTQLNIYGCSWTGKCIYQVRYHDGSQSQGYLVQDTLRFSSNIIKKFRYGCGHNNDLKVSNADGLLGFGRGPASIITQTAQSYDLVFSYCLPSKSDKIGYLALDKNPTHVQYTPMITSQRRPSFYFVNLISISIGREWLALSPSLFGAPGAMLAFGRKAMLDSRTVISRLPPITYSGIRCIFRKAMANYPRAPSWSILDTCYNFTNYSKVKVSVPKISFKFEGEVIINLDISGTLFGPSKSQQCLAFAGNEYDSDLVIIEKNSLVSRRGLPGENNLIDVESLLPSKSCSIPDKGMSPSMLILVDQCGPCSPLTCKDKLSLEDKYHQILKQDQARVDYINRLDATNSAGFNPLGGSLFATIPMEEGVIVGSHNFIVIIYLGTPPMPYSVIFDTGSDLTWIQCIPCDKCYPQNHPIYNPFESSTYAGISCFSNYCTQLNKYGCSWTNNCLYQVRYNDGSQSQGYLVQDTLRFSPNIIEKFRYGCGHNNSLKVSNADGLLGFGPGPASIITQTAQSYDLVFSYCLPSKSSIIGYLALGKYPTHVQYTPMITSQTRPSFYFVNLISISIGREWLALSPSVFGAPGTMLASGRKAMLDSRTVISRLPPITYSSIRSIFREDMANYPRAPSWSILDTCYNFTNYSKVKLSVPKISFKFEGEVIINLDISGTLFGPSKSQQCLAFSANKYDSDLVIIGNVQQRTFNIVHDINNFRIGFGANGCS